VITFIYGVVEPLSGYGTYEFSHLDGDYFSTVFGLLSDELE